MSLIGSLEDLGLGDILQIISLSQKSGVLVIRSDQGEGRIVFLDGLVRGAAVKGTPCDLRSLLIGGGFIDEATFNSCEQEASVRDAALEEVIAKQSGIASERIDSLRRESVESAVTRMFAWQVGDFSFDIREQPEPGDPPALVPMGINAQYLAMECSRLGDEEERDCDEPEQDENELSAHEMFGVDPEPAAPEPPAAAHDDTPAPGPSTAECLHGVEESEDLEKPDASPEVELLEVAAVEEEAGEAPVELATVLAEPAAVEAAQGDAPVGSAAAAVGSAPPVVAIDPDLPALEWTKDVLRPDFARVHIFQRADLGLNRIRQYLARGETPLVLVSPATAGDPLSGIPDARDFTRRLKAQAARMCVLWLCEDGSAPLDTHSPADGGVVRPASYQFRNPGAATQIARLAEGMRASVVDALARARGAGRPARDDISPEVLSRLKGATAALSEASSRGEVLPLVIRFAGETFSRVAMFVVRDGEAMGMAQAGLAAAGGPDDAGLRRVRLRADDSSWLQRVLQEGAPVCAPPEGEGDRRLALLLGDREPSQAYLAPIESAGQVIALIYGDNLPSDDPIRDTSALEVVLHHAGLALDRAALERALTEPEVESLTPAASLQGRADDAR